VRSSHKRFQKFFFDEPEQGLCLCGWVEDTAPQGKLREGRATTVTLQVDPQRIPAVALYKSWGFEEVGILENYYCQGRDALQMRLVFYR